MSASGLHHPSIVTNRNTCLRGHRSGRPRGLAHPLKTVKIPELPPHQR